MFKFTDKTYLNVLIVISIIMVIRYVAGIIFPDDEEEDNKKKYEGFDQSVPFVLKQNAEVFEDTFYSEIYDDIHLPSKIAESNIHTLVSSTNPSKKDSCFLDIGSGTGNLIHQLQVKGYRVYGIDKSQTMIDSSLLKYPEIQVKYGNILDPMTFEPGYFTHTICNNFTIYSFETTMKTTLIKNIFHWLVPGGYLVLHLIDPNKFDTIIPSGKPSIIDTPQKYSKIRITETALDFKTFQYNAKYDFDLTNNHQVHLTETFTDTSRHHTRQYEQTLFIEPMYMVLSIAQKSGFHLHYQSSFQNDQYQYLVILERPRLD